MNAGWEACRDTDLPTWVPRDPLGSYGRLLGQPDIVQHAVKITRRDQEGNRGAFEPCYEWRQRYSVKPLPPAEAGMAVLGMELVGRDARPDGQDGFYTSRQPMDDLRDDEAIELASNRDGEPEAIRLRNGRGMVQNHFLDPASSPG